MSIYINNTETTSYQVSLGNEHQYFALENDGMHPNSGGAPEDSYWSKCYHQLQAYAYEVDE